MTELEGFVRELLKVLEEKGELDLAKVEEEARARGLQPVIVVSRLETRGCKVDLAKGVVRYGE